MEEQERDFEGFREWWEPHKDDEEWMDEHFVRIGETDKDGLLPPGFMIYKTKGVGVTYIDEDGDFWLQMPSDIPAARSHVLRSWVLLHGRARVRKETFLFVRSDEDEKNEEASVAT